MKKAYTLLEILIVVIIIALMIGVFGFFMPDREDEQIKFGKEQSKILYTNITSSYNKIKKGYIEYFSGEQEKIQSVTINPRLIEMGPYSPERIVIDINELYKTKSINIDGQQHKNSKFLLQSKINPSPLPNNQIELNKNILTQAEIETLSCDHKSNKCITISKIIFNQSNQKIEQKKCLNTSGIMDYGSITYICTQWEQ